MDEVTKAARQAYRLAEKAGKATGELREAILKNKNEALNCAIFIDKEPRDDTRLVACQDSHYARCYAEYVDKGPRDDTRASACQKPYNALQYALKIDKGPRYDTRAATLDSPKWAYNYARLIDQCFRDDTHDVACKDPEFAYWYAYHLKATDATRAAVCNSPQFARLYAVHVDKGPTKETWLAVKGKLWHERDYLFNLFVSRDELNERFQTA